MHEVTRVRARQVYENDYIRVFDDDVSFASGTVGRYCRVEPATAGPGVVVVAVDGHHVGLVRTFRYPIGEFQWAFPRGFSHGEDALSSAAQEIEEELGLGATRLSVLGYVTPDSGMQSTRVAVVTAEVTGRGPGTSGTDSDEVAEQRWVDLGELDALIRSGGMEDGFTLAALAMWRAVGGAQYD